MNTKICHLKRTKKQAEYIAVLNFLSKPTESLRLCSKGIFGTKLSYGMMTHLQYPSIVVFLR